MVARDRLDVSETERVWAAIAELRTKVTAGFTSITRGSLRVASVEGLIVEGSERVDGTLVVHGTEEVDGLLRVTGTLIVSGTASITGPTAITGTTSIEGTTSVTGPMTVEGSLDITGPTVIAGTFSIDGDTTITGEVTVTGNITVDAEGRIEVGGMVLDPVTDGGALDFGSGRKVSAQTGFLGLYAPEGFVVINSSGPTMLHGDGGGFGARDDGPHILGADSVTSIDDVPGFAWLGVDSSNRIIKVPPGVGGPGGGAYEWPFPESTITWGFRPPERPTHDGIDFAGPEVTGHAIRAAAAGVVLFAGWSAGYGWYVDVSHAPIGGESVVTRYGHMLDPGPAVSTGDSVPKLGVLGTVGDTGASEGDHLHWEVHLDGDPVDPAAFMDVHGA